MNNEYLDKLPNDKFTIEASRAVSDARFKIREACTKAEAQNFIKDTLEKDVDGIDIIEFEDNNHDICLTMNNNIPDNEKLDYTVYYIVNRLFDQYVKKYIKGIIKEKQNLIILLDLNKVLLEKEEELVFERVE